jgi:hypothetical protein
MMQSRGLGPLSAGGGWIVDEALFRLLLDLEVHKARRLRYSVSIVSLMLERSEVGSEEASTASIAESVARHLRGTDAVTSWTQGVLLFLLVDAEATHLPAILERLTARFQTVLWSAGGSSYPRTAVRAEDMLRQALDLLTLARNEGGNRLYVAS